MSHACRPTLATVVLACLLSVARVGSAVPQTPAAGRTAIDPLVLAAMKWRSLSPEPGTQPRIGDATRGRGGRSIAVSGVRGRPGEAYFGATGGGLWKTTDSGASWMAVTDGQVRSASVGAVAVSETNPDLVYIGMGESCIRGDAMSGDGVYKSIDAGRTWTHVGFEDSPVISRIRIHPADPNVVFVAAFGKMSAPNPARGVFKTADGGRTWRRTLFRDERSGAVDVSIDRRNPNVVFAALWEAFRLEYTMSSGGPGSGLFKSIDGGETWKEITRNPGLPAGVLGKIGVDVSPADSNRVYAVVESREGGLFRSDDGGATWALVNAGRNIRQRAFYYTHITADPGDRDTVYVLNVGLFKSTDGGKTLEYFAFGDSHDLWIDPGDPAHMVHAMDGGGGVTRDGGKTWSRRDYPTAQYYHVVTTRHVPYHVCGAHQDGSSVCVSSAEGRGSRDRRRDLPVAPYGVGGTEPAYIAPDPKDLDVFFSGGNNGLFLERYNRRTGERREVGPYPRLFSGEPSNALVERIQWTFPIVFSPVDPDLLYTATQHVWKTTNAGQDWQRISPDLTRRDPRTMGDSGGPITHDMNSPEVYGTVFAIAPGKTDANVIWAGSDDGLIHLTRDGGTSWTNVTPPEMPEFGRVSIIESSAFDPDTAYAAVKRPLLDDFAPYIYRTHDGGSTWKRIVSGLPPRDFVHAVREDPTRRGLLYAATQHGVYVSFDDGEEWQPLSPGLPDAPVVDLVVEANDLVIATHGRGFYILEDIGPLRQSGPAVAAARAHLFKPGDALRSTDGALVQYLLREPARTLTIEVLDGAGAVLAVFEGGAGEPGERKAAVSAGLHDVTWDLRYPDATSFPGMILWGAGVEGPHAPPGTYQVRLTVDGTPQSQPLLVRRHPLYSATDADLAAQFDLAIRIRDKVSEANAAVTRIRAIRAEVARRLAASADGRLKAAGGTLLESLAAVEEEIYQVRNQSGQDPLNFPIRINNRLASLLEVINHGDGRPIGNVPVIFEDLVRELKVQTDRLREIEQAYRATF